ncbi:hypothetical protein J6590_062754 [Homalodisca vitripennis]|nr:hypothetical protein J6590_062754 [Homalodisca vitripennis]
MFDYDTQLLLVSQVVALNQVHVASWTILQCSIMYERSGVRACLSSPYTWSNRCCVHTCRLTGGGGEVESSCRNNNVIAPFHQSIVQSTRNKPCVRTANRRRILRTSSQEHFSTTNASAC